MTAVRGKKTGQILGNSGVQGVIPDLNSFSSCWGWDSPLQVGGRTGVVMVKECVGLQSALLMEDQVFSVDLLASFLGSPSAGAPEPTFHFPGVVDPGERVAPEDPQISAVGLTCWEDGGRCGEARHHRQSPRYGDEARAHCEWALQSVLEEEGGDHKAAPAAPMLCGEGEDEDEDEVSVAPYAHLVTLAVGVQASQLLSWAHY